MTKQHIGQRIKARREALGLTVQQLSFDARVPAQNIWGWEAGRKGPSDLVQLTAVARRLGVSLDWLCGLADDPVADDPDPLCLEAR